MTEQEMMILVPQKLREIEEAYQIKILFAAESGSRSWRTAAPDADFDVRFIYIRQSEEYLRLDQVRDTMEFPIEDGWDMSGWDLDKTLRLLYKSNPRIFEWFHSPIAYTGKEFAKRFEPIMDQYFSEKSAVFHYLNMARHQKDHFLQGDTVKLKKYLYAIHPLMAAQWVLDHHTSPPVVFRELMEAELPEFIRAEVELLIKKKMIYPEQKMIPREEPLDHYIQEKLDWISSIAATLPDEEERGWDVLNQFFLSELSRNKKA